MFSGKTTELIRRLQRYEVANHKCLIVKYSKDLRYESKCGVGVATHDHQSRDAIGATVLSEILDLAANCSVIGIDEGQFVSLEIIKKFHPVFYVIRFFFFQILVSGCGRI